ncbi:kinase-like domain-containing protein, partial [Epithele typhae]|uniref:kinase-like domain-containing protein n=1 Tax=Epithele typhae TaxID=378194 RepID=UPI002008C7E3
VLQAARMVDGRDVVIRVVRMGAVGEMHLRILTVLGRGKWATLSRNHALPLYDTIDLGDITFAVFPKAGPRMDLAFGPGIGCSVGDIMDMIMQCLEALEFLHSNGIAHRDASVQNFLVQYLPRSIAHRKCANKDYPWPGRPRVFIIDFELSVMFPEDTPSHEQVCVGPLYGGTVPEGNIHPHRCPPEVLTGEPYNPYMLDIWQFGMSLRFFRSTITEIDAVLERMLAADPTTRPSAGEALKQLAGIVAGIAPRDLQIPPIRLEDYD